MRKVILLVVIAFTAGGCVSTKGSSQQATINQLQMRVGELEQQVVFKNDEIDGLKYDIERLKARNQRQQEQVGSAPIESLNGVHKIESEGIIRINVEANQIQEALKKAGFYAGTVDNKIGGQTKEAIKAFQKAHGLETDGIVGMKTWVHLVKYL